MKVRKAVIVAGGVIASSHFLMRSGVKNVGQGMSCNFAFPVTFDFADDMKAYNGNQITIAGGDDRSCLTCLKNAFVYLLLFLV